MRAPMSVSLREIAPVRGIAVLNEEIKIVLRQGPTHSLVEAELGRRIFADGIGLLRAELVDPEPLL